MSTSNTYSFVTSQSLVITAALRKINVVGDFETLLSTDNRYVAAYNALNPLIKSYHKYGMPVWKINEATIPFSNLATLAGYTLVLGNTYTGTGGPVPLKVIQALRVDNLSGITVPLNIYTYEDYEILSNKSAQGTPVHLYYQPFRTTGLLKTWLLPDPTYWQVNGSLYIRFQVPYQDSTSGATNEELDFPIEWNKLLIYALAYDMAPEYGLDTEQRQLLKR